MNIKDLKPGSFSIADPNNGNLGTEIKSTISKPKSTLDTIGNVAQGVTNFFGGKGVADEFGASIARAFAPPEQKQLVDFPSTKQVVGSAAQLGANFVPGLGEENLLARTGAGLGAGYAMDVGSKLQNNEQNPLAPGVATAVGGALPGVGAGLVRPTNAIIGRLMKGLGSELSGVSGDTIDKIVSNPHAAIKASKLIAQQGNSKVLEGNARTVLNAVSQIKSSASSEYGKGLDSLSNVDINPEHLKEGFFGALNKHGVQVSPDGKIDFSGAEFLDPKIQQRAEGIMHTINSAPDLSGKGVRKLMDQVDAAKFKSAPEGDRQAFNAFMGDLSKSLREGVGKSTNKLDEINKNYHSDMELTDAAQNILGKVNYKNLPEVVNAANKLEGLFSQKGIAPEVVDKFLTRAGINPEDFKTSEAVRQISNKKDTANTKGVSAGELVRGVTSSVLTPELVKNISIATGLGKEKIAPFLSGLKTPARNAVIEALLQSHAEDLPQEGPTGNNL